VFGLHGPTRTRRYELPNDLALPSSPRLLSLANLLIFAAKLDEAVRLGRALGPELLARSDPCIVRLKRG
jgi:hypothetical protein